MNKIFSIRRSAKLFHNLHCDVERVGAIGARHAVAGAGGGCEFFFEAGDERAADEGRTADHFGNGRVDRGLDAQVLRVQVGKWNGDAHGGQSLLLDGSARNSRAGLPA